MIAIYIDDSFFGKSDYARDMRYKLRVTLKEMPVDMVLVSSNLSKEDSMKHLFEEVHVDSKISTDRFELDGHTFVLTNDFLQIDEDIHRPFAGTYLVVDTKTKETNRIYLDLFPKEETDLVSILMDAIKGTNSNSNNLKS